MTLDLRLVTLWVLAGSATFGTPGVESTAGSEAERRSADSGATGVGTTDVPTSGATLQQARQDEQALGALGRVDSRAYLAELTRYLYRWHLDESELRPALRAGEIVYHVRTLDPRLDEADDSRFAEVMLPQLGVRVLLKRADYAIPELGIEVRNDHHMVTRVDRLEPSDPDAAPPPGTTVVRIDDAWLRDHLFRTRSLVRPPNDAMLERMRASARSEIARHLADEGLAAPTTTQTLHLAPISRVANEAWVHWEEGRLLVRFHADIDLDEHADWESRRLDVTLYDLDEQVVVTLDEVAGSNAFVTRDLVGRVLFNCVVLGRRVLLEPEQDGRLDD